MRRNLFKGLILAAIARLAAPDAHAALPACATQCACSCGFGCWSTHACLIRWRIVEHAPLIGQPNRYRITSRLRGGMRTDSQGTYSRSTRIFRIRTRSSLR